MIQPGRVIEGVVTNVASFCAFVDVGRKQDAMIHISELASRRRNSQTSGVPWQVWRKNWRERFSGV